MESPQSQFESIAYSAHVEFEDISDYIWKSLNIIGHEAKKEKQKLESYFPNNPELKELRASLESNKLKSVFPYLIISGNMFSVMSILESYLLMIAKEIESITSNSISNTKGNGINRFLNYINIHGVNLEVIYLYDEIRYAIKIRNCLLHASGFLDWSKEATEIKRIQKSGLYLSKGHRTNRLKQNGDFDELQIVTSEFGERLSIKNKYPHILAFYAREFIGGACNELQSKFST